MLRRLLSSVMDTLAAQQSQQEAAIYQCPFTKKELAHLSWLSSITPCFHINAKCISILKEPQQFYNTLIEKCLESKYRITLASLYLGNGTLERQLVDAVYQNQNFQKGDVKVNILLDFARGSRYTNNSRLLLKPLLEKNETNCNISLYHTPVLRGIKKQIVPNRWNEVFGLQHMKLYIFDDTLIISGANLSNDYFTNRQDRYFVIKDKALCDFYCGLVSKVQNFSLQLDKSDNLCLSEGWTQLPYEGRLVDFVNKAADMVERYILNYRDEQNIYKREGCDTWVYPLFQMGQLGIEQDACVTARLFSEAPIGTRLFMATGYFNLTERYMSTICNSLANCNILMAHPNANGFQGASFPAGGIPSAYTLIARRFKAQFEKLGHGNRITLQEYLREGWTYHAKGLWYYSPGEETPCLTLIGSPNFGERSVRHDLETQLAIVTENHQLREELQKEVKWLYELGLPADTDRFIPKWVYPVVFFLKVILILNTYWLKVYRIPVCYCMCTLIY